MFRWLCPSARVVPMFRWFFPLVAVRSLNAQRAVEEQTNARNALAAYCRQEPMVFAQLALAALLAVLPGEQPQFGLAPAATTPAHVAQQHRPLQDASTPVGGSVRPSAGSGGTKQRRREIGTLADELRQLERGATTAHAELAATDKRADEAVKAGRDYAKGKRDLAYASKQQALRDVFEGKADPSDSAAAGAAGADAAKAMLKDPPVPVPLWAELGFKMLKNTLQATQDLKDDGQMGSVHIPREYEDGEAGTNAWPVPSWWNRVPSWWDRAPQWWTLQTKKWASKNMIAGQFEADMFSAVN